MVKVNIVAVGKVKEKYFADGISEYAKRLSAFCKLNIVELTPERLSDNPSEKEIENALTIEAKKIIDKIPKGSYIYSLCIEGKQISSEELSAEIEAVGVGGTSSIVFIIGSSFGLSDAIKRMSNKKLSMSKMTFPHQLARVMLLEQIYRAVQISAGTKYHK
jgi:23S rRNA (pseudouridine1915-N3)-methyltransferase